MKSSKKQIFIDKEILEKIQNNETVYTKSRSSTIVPSMFDKYIHVYNGKKFIKIRILPDMIGHKLGEFVPTRILKIHTSLSKNTKKKK